MTNPNQDDAAPFNVAAFVARPSLTSIDDYMYAGACLHANMRVILKTIEHFAPLQELSQDQREQLRNVAASQLERLGIPTSYFLMREALATHSDTDGDAAQMAIKRWVQELATLVNEGQRTLRLMQTFGPTVETAGIMRRPQPAAVEVGGSHSSAGARPSTALEDAFVNPTLPPPTAQTILLDATNRCNFRCITCSQGVDQKFAQFDLAWFELDELHEWIKSSRVVHLAGRGEPLLSPAIWGLIRSALAGSATIGMTTNGTMLGRLSAPEGMEGRFSIGLSLDGGRPETAEAIRRGFNWQRTQAMLLRLPKSWRERITLAVTVTRLNYNELPELVAFANEMGIRTLNLQQFYPFMPWHDGLVLRLSDYDDLARSVAELAARPEYAHIGIVNFTFRPAVDACSLAITRAENFASIADVAQATYANDRSPLDALVQLQQLTYGGVPDCLSYKVPLPGPNQQRPPLTLGTVRDDATIEVPSCLAAWTTAYVHSDGGVRPCCSILAPLGSLLDHDIDTVWSNEGYAALRRSLKSDGRPAPPCIKCTDSVRFAGLESTLAELREKWPSRPFVAGFALEELPTPLRPVWDRLATPTAKA